VARVKIQRVRPSPEEERAAESVKSDEESAKSSKAAAADS
jgi:hypothetical protein